MEDEIKHFNGWPSKMKNNRGGEEMESKRHLGRRMAVAEK